MTDTSPQALRALADEINTRIWSRVSPGRDAATTLRKLAAEKEAARDARRAALEEAAKAAISFVPANPLNHIMSQAIEDHGRVIEAAIRALIDREPEPVVGETTASDVLRELSSWLGAGFPESASLGNLRERIKWGVDHQINATLQRAADVVEECSKKPWTTWGQVRAAILALQAAAPTPTEPTTPATED